MRKWLLIHQNSQVFLMLSQALGPHAVCIHRDDFIKNVQVDIDLEKKQYYLHYQEKLIDLKQCIIMQEVFYAMKASLSLYHPADHKYVESTWQSYLLALCYTQLVLNPIYYEQLSISYYQMKSLVHKAKILNICIPRMSLGVRPSYPSIGYAYLWFQPHGTAGEQMYVEVFHTKWLYIPFVYHPRRGLWLGKDLPKQLHAPLIRLVQSLNLSYGEFYFQKEKDYVFYGLCPRLSEQFYTKRSLASFIQILRSYYAVL
ncbi:hypothetical protein OAT84_04280 [Gammaproteobacteria bacterium]|nr:hypothetical protein [Gammaproteobacteria bacterium]